MLSRIRGWLAAPTHTAPPGASAESGESADTEREVARDAQLGELATKLATVTRAQSKLSLRLDELATQVDSNHAALLSRLGPAPDDITDVLDALDRLEDAIHSLTAEQRAVADGLAGIPSQSSGSNRRSTTPRSSVRTSCCSRATPRTPIPRVFVDYATRTRR